MNVASCKLGSNFSPIGSVRSRPCFFSVFINIVSVIFSPSYKFFKSLFSDCNASAGTVVKARSRLSTLSTRSLAKEVMAKERAELTSRFVRSCRLRKSATARRYLSFASVSTAVLSVVFGKVRQGQAHFELNNFFFGSFQLFFDGVFSGFLCRCI